jgi:pSer/pThr/pTyr-binding forkhead associated (FHA) protein
MIAIAKNPPADQPEPRFGQLVPIDAAGNPLGGDTIPLRKKKLLIGRRESCDIVLRFPDVSLHHCQMWLRDGHWYVEDLHSRNGTRINGDRLEGTSRLDHGDTLSIAKLRYLLRYSP